MAGYLDEYGAGDERREKRNRWLLYSGGFILFALLLAWFLWGWDKSEIVRAQPVARFVQKIRHHSQERAVEQFLELVKIHQYEAAYRLWHPNSEYPLDKFMEDWGPRSQRQVSAYDIIKSRTCGTGVIITVDMGKAGQENLWVEKRDQSFSFSPYPVCPAGS